jgi:hypothetical protein
VDGFLRLRLVCSEAHLPERGARVDLDDLARTAPAGEGKHAVPADMNRAFV